MHTAARFWTGLVALGCALPIPVLARPGSASSKPAATVTSPKPASEPARRPVALATGFSEDGRFALQLADKLVSAGMCRELDVKLLELSGRSCSKPDDTRNLAGRCIEKEEGIKIHTPARLCGTVLLAAVAAEGELLAFASNRDGVFLQTKRSQGLVPLAGVGAQRKVERSSAVEPTSLLFFSEDHRSVYLVPLAQPPMVIDLAAGTEVTPSRAQVAEIERRSLLKSRIRLFAHDDRLKEVGLRWALRLGDVRNMDVVARIAATTKDPVLAALAGELLEGYRRWINEAQAPTD